MIRVKAIIDRIENKFAVLEIEGRISVDFPLEFLPLNSKEGEEIAISLTKMKQALE